MILSSTVIASLLSAQASASVLHLHAAPKILNVTFRHCPLVKLANMLAQFDDISQPCGTGYNITAPYHGLLFRDFLLTTITTPTNISTHVSASPPRAGTPLRLLSATHTQVAADHGATPPHHRPSLREAGLHFD